MNGIEIYEKHADRYEKLQLKRPDYSLAVKAFFDYASIHLKIDKGIINLVDFCCGIGNMSRLIANKFSVNKVTLIDTNRDFLDIAEKTGIKAVDFDIKCADILSVKLKREHDLVISMFAYHHVIDKDKMKFIEIAKSSLNNGGILLLGEIYSPDKETTLKYYDYLLKSIKGEDRSPDLLKFIMQTAHSDNFEFKVSRKFAHDQLEKSGFILKDKIKVWPNVEDKTLPDDVGTFIEVWQSE